MIFHNRKTFFIILSVIVFVVLFFSNPQSISTQFVDINNLGGVISSAGNLQLAAEGDINNISTTKNNLASITGNNLNLDAGGSITNTAAELKATGDISLHATRKIDFNTLAQLLADEALAKHFAWVSKQKEQKDSPDWL